MTADIRRFDEIDSTNEEARRLGDAGQEGPVWIVAARQTAGRGRRGRAWESPTGNFMGTLYLTPRCGPREAGELSFVAALAVHDAVASLLPPPLRPALRLKWPNDLLHERAKLAGILLESSGVAGAEVAWVAIGMGVNLAVHPEGLEYPATSLAAMGVPGVTPDDALKALDASFEHWLAVWRGVQGFAAIREAWLKRAEGIGGSITVRLSAGNIEGTFEGLAPDGGLQLRLPDGRLELVSAGDVFFGSPVQ
ncbi:biotin--[acetyl-CoA-carboxylase] ligase [Parvibaculum sp.]|uniref:biotin--[acetyl-CoA-carboxylase] ligase n=1 Tax=Parvibaculum sp. TaxID=2024848 RepID=UPI001B1FF7AA|nr:biotin--[acetyl-CoA-carboxylase] ligase [Parvibaculum sp.]MBO6667540.1 biotin--[acetyl-CoA-carboxylase] ligase [Parvibaculum sp.]MBO6693632.1 biotin--[acetyl-CoA-carboxylase] ligase [Parvibaculum sp.]MBO6714092.1 biotin--[acetyl-CoA-carboxylase] ligase [Parvibaculum sp.]